VRYLYNIMYKKDLVQGSTRYGTNPAKRIILYTVVMMIWVIENEMHSHFNT